MTDDRLVPEGTPDEMPYSEGDYVRYAGKQQFSGTIIGIEKRTVRVEGAETAEVRAFDYRDLEPAPDPANLVAEVVMRESADAADYYDLLDFCIDGEDNRSTPFVVEKANPDSAIYLVYRAGGG